MPEENNGQNAKQNLDIAEIKKDIEFIKVQLIEIKQNHLHEINEEIKGLKEEIEAIKKELQARPTWAVTMLCAITVGLISFIIGNFFVR